MKKKIRYSYHEVPAWPILLLFSIQYLVIILSWQFITLAIVSTLPVSLTTKESILSITLLSCAIITIIQTRGLGWFGAKKLIPPSSNPVYAGPSLLAIHLGGLPLLYGMTLFSGMVEMMISPFLRWTKYLLPPKYIGAVIILIGLEVANSGLIKLWQDSASSKNLINLSLGFLLILLVLFMQTKINGVFKYFAYLSAAIIGNILYFLINGINSNMMQAIKQASVIQFPHFSALGHWRFNPVIIVPFLLTSLIASFKVVCSISLMNTLDDQHQNTKKYQHNLTKGNLADALGTLLCGLMGGTGINVSSTCVSLSIDANVNNKYIAYATAFMMFIVALSGKLMFFILITPSVVIGSLFIALGATLLLNGLMMSIPYITANSVDMIIFALSLIVGLSRGLFPNFYNHLSIAAKMFTGSEIATGAVFIILINVILISVKQLLKLVSY